MEFDLGPDLKLFKISLVACSRCSSGSGVWREMEITSLPTKKPLRVFFLNLLFFAPSTLSECLEQIISPESVTSVILSLPHPRIPRGNHFNHSDQEERSGMGSSA